MINLKKNTDKQDKIQELASKMKLFVETSQDILTMWQEIDQDKKVGEQLVDELDRDYPFEHSFEDMQESIAVWSERVVNFSAKRDWIASRRFMTTCEYHLVYGDTGIESQFVFVYEGGTYIEARADGLFYTIIDRSDIETDDLDEVQNALWDWVLNNS